MECDKQEAQYSCALSTLFLFHNLLCKAASNSLLLVSATQDPLPSFKLDNIFQLIVSFCFSVSINYIVHTLFYIQIFFIVVKYK